MRHPILTFLLSAIIFIQICGCTADGLIGKNTNKNITDLTKGVVASTKTISSGVTSSVDTITDMINETRRAIFKYLKFGASKTAHDISIAIMQGTIGYLDSAQNARLLVSFVDSLILHTGNDMRYELIAFRDSLLSEGFICRTRLLLRGVMQELVQNPTESLANFAFSNNTRGKLDSLLEMLIPAILNDRAIKQIGSLRETILGQGMKKDMATLIDTSLQVLNMRLDSNLSKSIHRIVQDNTSTIQKHAVAIMWSLIGAVIVVGLVIYFLQQQRIKKKNSMLAVVTNEIQKTRGPNKPYYDHLTGNIRQKMLERELETDMYGFLTKNRINTK